MKSVLEIKKEIEDVSGIIARLDNEYDNLDEKVAELYNQMESVEAKRNNAEGRKHQLINLLNDEIARLGALGSGNELIDVLRKTFSYTGNNSGPSLFRAYFIDHHSVLGTNSYVAFEVRKVNTPSNLRGKYIFYEAAIEPDNLNNHIYTEEQLEGDLTGDQIKKMMIKFLSQMNNHTVLDSISALDGKRDSDLFKVKLGNVEMAFQYQFIKPLENLFSDEISVYWSKVNQPICIQDRKTTVILAPVKITEPVV